MTYNKERHKQLVIREQELKNQGKLLFRENPEENLELCKYNVLVDNHVYWTHREKFLLLMKNLLDNSFDFDEFETAFSIVFEEVRKEVNIFTRDLEQIEKFQPSTKSYLSGSFGSIYRQFEAIEDEYLTEQDVKDYVKKTYLEFQQLEE